MRGGIRFSNHHFRWLSTKIYSNINICKNIPNFDIFCTDIQIPLHLIENIYFDLWYFNLWLTSFSANEENTNGYRDIANTCFLSTSNLKSSLAGAYFKLIEATFSLYPTPVYTVKMHLKVLNGYTIRWMRKIGTRIFKNIWHVFEARGA